MQAPRSLPAKERKPGFFAKVGAIASVLAGLAYGISPLDLIPDLIPLLGWSDDVAVLIGAGVLAYRLLRRRRQQVRTTGP